MIGEKENEKPGRRPSKPCDGAPADAGVEPEGVGGQSLFRFQEYHKRNKI